MKIIFPLPFVVDGAAVSHDAELLILQFVLLETATSDIAPSAVTNTSDDETESCASTTGAFFFLPDIRNVTEIKNAQR